MSVSICVLGSGSSGNCTFIGTPGTGLLVDAGLSGRETVRRATLANLPLDRLAAVLLTHEHHDHTCGLGVLQRRHRVALYANSGTIDRLEKLGRHELLRWTVFQTGSPFELGDFRVEPFSVPHDALDPVGFIFTSGGVKVGVVTDMGMATTLIRERLRHCRILVVEANHDEHLLKQSGRPWSLIQRILGRQGHLSNEQAAELVETVLSNRLRAIFPAHLSEDCNTPECALFALRAILQKKGCAGIALLPTHRDGISEHLVF